MRITVNLATRPFVELRPLFARLRLAMAGLAVLGVGLGIGLHVMSARAHGAQAQMDALKAKTTALENERITNEARMRQPQNRAVLERSEFLNGLFTRKSFSWTAVMMDLERVLPAGVQVTSIEPAVLPDGNVNIRLRVTGDRERTVEFVRNLERSQRFMAPRLANETAQEQQQGKLVPAAQVTAPGGVEFDILSGYNPLPLKPEKASAKEVGNLGSPATPKTASSKGPGKATARDFVKTGKAAKPAKPGVTH